jgi:hypothetical protein
VCAVSRAVCEKRESSPTSTRTRKERNREGHDFSRVANQHQRPRVQPRSGARMQPTAQAVGAAPQIPTKPRRGGRNALRIKHRPCGNKIGSRNVWEKLGCPVSRVFCEKREVRRHQHDPGRKETGKGTTSVVPPSRTNVPGFSRGAAQECSPRRKPWGQRHKPQPSPGGAKEPNPKYIAHRTQRCSS